MPSTSVTPASRSYSQDQPTKDVYEMQWRNDLPEATPMTKRSATDEEAWLWKGNTNDKNVAVTQDSAEKSRMYRKPPTEAHVRSTATSPAPSIAPSDGTLRYSTSNCIHVTSETSVSYSLS